LVFPCPFEVRRVPLPESFRIVVQPLADPVGTVEVIEVRVLEQVVNVVEVHFLVGNEHLRMLAEDVVERGRAGFHGPTDDEVRCTKLVRQDPIAHRAAHDRLPVLLPGDAA